MRSEHNIGADGGERSSVKVHHQPGGKPSFNIFGGYGYDHQESTTSSGSYGGAQGHVPSFSAPKAPLQESTNTQAPSFPTYGAPSGPAPGGFAPPA